MFEAIIWFILVTAGFAVVNRLWMWLFVKVEMSRLEARDEFAEAAATIYADSRAASTT
ncbi:MAG: hypothetical protein LAN37_08255 [Acidobacteriia bacterium]|nr:hypothetical protein [Terriglobia bacterium]